ncbi:hypothetical protein H5T54_03585 [Candidatus Bipolaricaulota bacterium]|nr:hypothetical protein [Candidatus Bipolaricaulota bacterium]
MPRGSSGAPDRSSPRGVPTKAKRRPDHDEAEVLRKLAQPGCLFCREEEEAEERFFLWYLAESYLFPETLNRMIRAHGFCRVHTQRFAKDGIPSTGAYVYRFLARAALGAVGEAERLAARRGDRKDVARPLLPTATCLACARREAHVAHVQHRLARVLAGPESRPTLPPSPALCLPHLRTLAPRLDRNGLRLLAAGLRERLAGEDPCAALSWAWGAPLPRRSSSCVEEHNREDERAPTTRGALVDRLAAPGCPVCRAEARIAARFTGWLAGEIRIAPRQAWASALRLCPEHGWAFAQAGAEGVVAELANGIRELWGKRLTELDQALAAAPAGGLGPRLRFLRTRVRARTASRGEAFWAALPEALRSERQTAQLHARRVFRVEPCPLCRAVETAGERTAALLSASLGDPAVQRAYQAGDGVCLRHLPVVLAQARGDEARLLLATARVRLSVLNWELAEFLRKQSWDVRYEEPGPEGTAWRRAAASLSGVPEGR